MIAYIKGKIVGKFNGYIIIESNNIGYKINMSNNQIGQIEEEQGIAKIYTYLKHNEDEMSLFGFNSQDELNMFETLISVSGVGAKTAIIMLGEMSPTQIALAILNEDITAITKIPGIGPKGAKRIILELKDKVVATDEQIEPKLVKNDALDEAIAGLVVLGYMRKDIVHVFEKIDTSSKTVEELIKIGLKYLS